MSTKKQTYVLVLLFYIGCRNIALMNTQTFIAFPYCKEHKRYDDGKEDRKNKEHHGIVRACRTVDLIQSDIIKHSISYGQQHHDQHQDHQ